MQFCMPIAWSIAMRHHTGWPKTPLGNREALNWDSSWLLSNQNYPIYFDSGKPACFGIALVYSAL